LQFVEGYARYLCGRRCGEKGTALGELTGKEPTACRKCCKKTRSALLFKTKTLVAGSPGVRGRKKRKKTAWAFKETPRWRTGKKIEDLGEQTGGSGACLQSWEVVSHPFFLRRAESHQRKKQNHNPHTYSDSRHQEICRGTKKTT